MSMKLPKLHFLSSLSNLMMARVIRYIGICLVALILIQFYATYRLQIENRDNSIVYALENIAPVLELSLWNYNHREVKRLSESLEQNQLIQAVVITDDFGNMIAGSGDDSLIKQFFPGFDNLERIAINLDVSLFSRKIFFQDVEDPVLIGEVVVLSRNNLIWWEIAETLFVIVMSLFGFVIIVLAILYGVQYSFVSRRLEILSNSLSLMESEDKTLPEDELHELIQYDDELTNVYHDYWEIRQRLKERDAELTQYHKDLELKVDTRTGELKLANEFLTDSLSKLKLAQTELVEQERLASLGGLVSGIAHEVNTPLGVSITANSFLWEEVRAIDALLKENKLTKTAMSEFMDSCEDSCSIIAANMARAATLVKSFKQIAVDQSSEESRELHVSEYLSDIIRSLRPHLKRSHVSVLEDFRADFTISTYGGALAQVVTNLIMNAFIHGYDKGQIEGDIHVSLLESARSDHELVISIKDEGAGIPKDIVDKIYDPFFTTKRGQGGSGLGLNIVYNLVVQTLQGKLECKSEYGKGTEFLLYLQNAEKRIADE